MAGSKTYGSAAWSTGRGLRGRRVTAWRRLRAGVVLVAVTSMLVGPSMAHATETDGGPADPPTSPGDGATDAPIADADASGHDPQDHEGHGHEGHGDEGRGDESYDDEVQDHEVQDHEGHDEGRDDAGHDHEGGAVSHDEPEPTFDLFADDNGGEQGPVDHVAGLPWNLGPTPGIAAEGAWDAGVTGAGVTVAVIDSGVDVDHPDLAGRLATSTAPDGTGPTTGWNFRDGTSDVTDETGHGTHVAGVIARVAPDARILPLKILGPEGGSSSDAAAAVSHAVATGADVINASWSLTGPSPELAAAIAHADSRGVVFVTSAGAGGFDLDLHVVHPGPGPANVVVATAVGADGALVPGANHGSAVLGAPGQSIPAAQPGGGYGLRSGTSVGAAHVSGVAALAASAGHDGRDAAGRLATSAATTEAGVRVVDATAMLATASDPASGASGDAEPGAIEGHDAEAGIAGVDVQADSSLVVTNTNDSGPGSLRQAVADANANPGLDTITFAPALTGATIVLTSGQLVNTQPLVVDGSGAPGIALDGNQSSRVLFADGAALTLRRLTVQNGRTEGLTNVAARGGGVRGVGATVTIEDSIIQYNTSLHTGGGVWVQNGAMVVERSLVLGNVAQHPNGGGGLKTDNSSMVLRNSTVTQNTSPGHGGGLHFHGGTLATYFSTIVYNESPDRGANVDFTSGSWTTSVGTVVGFPIGGTANCNQAPGTRSFNYEVGATSCGFGSTSGNVSNGADPDLGPLADNGGPTRTFLPAGDSPLVDAATSSGPGACAGIAVATDQRGIGRPQGSGCDIGAAEVGLDVAKSSLTVASGTSGNQQTVRVTVGADQTNLTVADEISPALIVTNVTATGGGDCSATAGNDVSCTWANVTAGSTVTVRITFSVPVDVPQQTIVNTASVTSDAMAGTAEATGIITVLGVFDLDKRFEPPVVGPGTIGNTIEIDVENLSNFAQTDVVVTDEVDAALTVTGATASAGGDCSATSGNAVSCTWATMAAGATGTVTITYDVPVEASETSITDEATVDSNEALPVSTSATLVVANLALEKRFVEKYVAIGGTGYTIELTVHAVGDQTNVVVQDPVPALFSVTGATADEGGDCSATSGNNVSCSWAELDSGTAATVTITYNAPTNNQFVSVVTNTASVQSDQSPARQASDTVTVTNIVVATSFLENPVDEGSTGNTFVIAVTNTLGSSQTIVATNTVPGALTVTGVTPSGNGNCGVSGNSVSCSWNGVSAGATVNVVVAYDVPIGSRGVVTNTAYGSASQTTPIPASDSVTIEATSASITIDTRTTPSGDSSTSFPFTVSSDATAIDPFTIVGEDSSPTFVVMPGTYTFVEDLPAGWELAGVTGIGGTCTQDGEDAGTLIVGPGDDVTCRFTNAATTAPRITIESVTVPGGDVATVFPFSVTGPTPVDAFSVVGEGTSPALEVTPGTYTFTTVVPAGWSLTQVSGTGGTCTRSGSSIAVSVTAGDEVVCSLELTSDDAAWATVAVQTVPAGDTTSPFEVVLAGDVAPEPIVIVGEGSRQVAVWPGTYTVGLVTAAWRLSTVGGDCDEDGTVTVPAGASVDCTITLIAGGGGGQGGGSLDGPGATPDDPQQPGQPGGIDQEPGTFGPDQPLEVRLCPPGERGTPPCVLVGTGTSNADGSATIDYTIPPNTPPGTYELVVTDPLGNESVTTIFVGPGPSGPGGPGAGDGGGPDDGSGPGTGSGPDAGESAGPDGELPFTGSGSSIPLVVVALLLALAGSVLVAPGRGAWRALAETS